MEGQSKCAQSVLTFTSPTEKSSAQNEAFKQIKESIASGVISFPTLVVMLKESLTSSDDLCRARGVLLMSKVLDTIPSLTLDQNALSVLVNFYSDRMSDFPTTEEVILGVTSLLRHHTISEGSLLQISTSLFANVETQGRLQRVRHSILSLVKLLITSSTFRPSLLTIQEPLTNAVVSYVDGERDPRNILISFSLVQILLSNFPKSHKAIDEFFDIVTCYFPIQFRTRPTDPDQITAEQLKVAFSSCLSSTSAFANLSIPFFVDKIGKNDGEEDVKCDALSALEQCFEFYDRSVIISHCDVVWAALCDELAISSEGKVVGGVAGVVGSLAKQLSSSAVFFVDKEGKSKTDTIEAFSTLTKRVISDMKVLFLHPAPETTDEPTRLSLDNCASVRAFFVALSSCSSSPFVATLFSSVEEVVGEVVEFLKGSKGDDFMVQSFLDFLFHFVGCGCSAPSAGAFSSSMEAFCRTILQFGLDFSPCSESSLSAPPIVRIRSVSLVLRCLSSFSFLPLSEVCEVVQKLTMKYIELIRGASDVQQMESSAILTELLKFLLDYPETPEVFEAIFGTLTLEMGEAESGVFGEEGGVNGLLEGTKSPLFEKMEGYRNPEKSTGVKEVIPSLFASFSEMEQQKEGEEAVPFPSWGGIESFSTPVRSFYVLSNALAVLGSTKAAYTQAVGPYFVDRFEKRQEQAVKKEGEKRFAYAKLTIECLLVLFRSSSLEEVEESHWVPVLASLFSKLQILLLSLLSSCSSSDKMEVDGEEYTEKEMEKIGGDVSQLCGLLNRSLFSLCTASFQSSVLSFFSQLALSSSSPPFLTPETYNSFCSSLSETPLTKLSPSLISLPPYEPFSPPFLPLLTSLFASCQNDLLSSSSSLTQLVLKVAVESLKTFTTPLSLDHLTKDSLCQLFAVLLNKFGDVFQEEAREYFNIFGFSDGKEFDEWVVSFIEGKCLEGDSLEQRELTLCLLMWTMRGLLLRGAKVDFVSTFLRVLDAPRLSGSVACLARLFFGESDVALHKEGHTVTRPFVLQKFYFQIQPKLRERLRSSISENSKDPSEVEKRQTLFECLGALFLSLPLDVIYDDVASLVVLCQGKEGLIPYQNREKIVRALGNVLAENPDKFVSNLEANISALLAFMEGENTLETRKQAVHVMNSLCRGVILGIISYHKIFPFKERIEDGLFVAVEDRKRVVRAAAAGCRNYWMSIGGP